MRTKLEAAAAWWIRWRLFILCIAVPRMLSPNFGHRLSTQFSVEVLHASRTNLGMLDSVRHWVGLVSNPLGGFLARTRGIKWLIVLHTVRHLHFCIWTVCEFCIWIVCERHDCLNFSPVAVPAGLTNRRGSSAPTSGRPTRTRGRR